MLLQGRHNVPQEALHHCRPDDEDAHAKAHVMETLQAAKLVTNGHWVGTAVAEKGVTLLGREVAS